MSDDSQAVPLVHISGADVNESASELHSAAEPMHIAAPAAPHPTSEHRQAVDFAYNCVLFLVEPDASREVAQAAIDHAPKLLYGMSFAVRAAVLERFEPEPERVPVPFLDYLPGDDAAVLP